tara:strand:- start:230 stop:361 length:132 start_codon:yes stop_codon:yes gene_type:complete
MFSRIREFFKKPQVCYPDRRTKPYEVEEPRNTKMDEKEKEYKK